MKQMIFFFNDTATTEIYTLSLHDALPIYDQHRLAALDDSLKDGQEGLQRGELLLMDEDVRDRKSTRLNSSHANISYAVFCLKKNKFTPSLSSFLDVFLLSTLSAYFLRPPF